MKFCVESKTRVSEVKIVTEERFTDDFDDALRTFAYLYLSGEHYSIHISDTETGEVYATYGSLSGKVWLSDATSDHLSYVMECARVYKCLTEI